MRVNSALVTSSSVTPSLPNLKVDINYYFPDKPKS